MHVIGPGGVSFGGVVLPGVSWVRVEEKSVGLVEEWGDDGPHQVVCQSVRRRVVASVEQPLEGLEEGGVPPLRVGRVGELVVRVGGSRADGMEGVVRVAGAVVVEVRYEVGHGERSRRVTVMVGVSVDGASDPVSVVV